MARTAPDLQALGMPGSSETPLVLTAAELAGCEAELAALLAKRDQELPAALREARTFVASDAIEEIQQIHERRAALDARIATLEHLLRTARVAADDDGGRPGSATLGSVVEVEDADTGLRATYRLVGSGRAADPGTVSARSPVGQALLGHRPGDVVTVELPSGRTIRLRLLRVGDG